MTALRKDQRDPRGETRAVVAARPFAAPVAELAVPDGLTLAEMVTLAVVNGSITRAQAASPHLQIRIHGHVVPRALWVRVRPRRGALIELRIRPMGGGGGKKNPLRTILQLLVVVVVSYITAGAGGLLIAGSTTAMVAAGVASIALNALVNAIAPIPQPQQPKRSETYTLDGARNAADPYGACTIVLGRHRLTPRLAMRYYTEVVNESGRDIMYLYMLVQWHVGKCALSEIKIGDTDIATYQGVVMEHRLAGESYASAISLIPRVCIEEGDIQIELRSGVWNTRTTQRDTVRISFDLCWPGGLFRTQDGYYKRVDLDFAMEYRLVGAPSWTGVPLAASGLMTGVGTASYWNADVNMKRKMFAWDVPAGQYELRIKRVTADSDDRRRTDTTFWIGLRSFKAVAPVLDDLLCVTALKIRASDQLNGVLDNLNAIVESHVPVWNGTNWNTVAASRNPAALYRWLLTGPAISPVRRLASGGLDGDYVSAFYDYCVTKELTCDTVIDYAASVEEVAQIICSAGNATAIASRGKRLPVIDDTKVPSQLFTSQTVRNFRATLNYPEEVHALRCTFANAAAGYRPDERLVYAPGYSEANATKFQTAEIPGKVDADDVWYAGRRLIQRGLIRRIGYEFEVDSESLVSRYGQRILVEHFALRREAMSATVTAIVGSPGSVTGVTLSEFVTMEHGTLYGLQLRRGDDGTLPLFDVVNPASPGSPVTTRTLTFTGTVLPAFEPEIGDLCVWGERTKMTKDLSIIHVAPGKGDYTAALTCVPYSDALFADDEEDAPAFESYLNERQRQGIIINPVEDPADVLRRLGEALLIGSAASDDGAWTTGEKSVLVPILKEVIASQAALDTRATALGITTEKAAFDSAMTALNAYLATLVTPDVTVAWDDYTDLTEVVAATFNPLFRDAMEKRNALQAKIDELNANALIIIGGQNLFTKANWRSASYFAATFVESGAPNGVSGWGFDLARVTSTPGVHAAARAWAQGIDYTISFIAQRTAGSGTVNLQVDLYPDTLPQQQFVVSATASKFSWTFNSSHADMASAQLRFFIDQVGDNNKTVRITDIMVERGNKTSDWVPAPGDSDNALVPLSQNALFNSAFAPDLSGWLIGASDVDTGFVPASVRNPAGKSGTNNVLGTQITGTPASGKFFISSPSMNTGTLADKQKLCVKVVAGQRLFASAMHAQGTAGQISSALTTILYFDSAGTYHSEVSFSVGSLPTGANGDPANYVRAAGFHTVPSGAAMAIIRAFYVTAGGANPLGLFMQPYLGIVRPDVTAFPDYQPGPLSFGNVVTNLAGTEQLNNALVPAGEANRIRYSRMERGTVGYGVLYNPSSLANTPSSSVWLGRAFYKTIPTFTASGQDISVGTARALNPIPVRAGERVAVQTGIEATGAAVGIGYASFQFFDSSNAFISSVNSASFSGTQAYGTMLQWFATVPANAVNASIEIYFKSTGAGTGNCTMIEPMVSGAIAGQTVFPSFSPGSGAEAGADVTLSNTAAAITGQADWATYTGVSTGTMRYHAQGTPYPNMIRNAHGKLGAGFWTVASGTALVSFYPGSGAVDIDNNAAWAASSGSTDMYQDVPVRALNYYSFYAQLAAWNYTSGSLELAFEWRPSGTALSVPNRTLSSVSALFPTLQNFQAPVGATHLRISMKRNSWVGDGGFYNMKMNYGPVVTAFNATDADTTAYTDSIVDQNTVIGRAGLVTSLGTASAIAGQKSGATTQITTASSAPGSPATGDWWLDTTTPVPIWKRYNGSSWVATNPDSAYVSTGGQIIDYRGLPANATGPYGITRSVSDVIGVTIPTTQITIVSHTVYAPGGSISVTGGTITGLTAATVYDCFWRMSNSTLSAEVAGSTAANQKRADPDYLWLATGEPGATANEAQGAARLEYGNYL